MRRRVIVSIISFFFGCSILTAAAAMGPTLHVEPEEDTRIDEVYDRESDMLLFLYSIKGDGEIDYVSGRSVVQHVRSEYGNPVYYYREHSLFYWWNHMMWTDPGMDGVNGNERVYQDDIDFDPSRYKPCVFNGQAC